MSKALNNERRARLKKERNIWIATVRPGGRPHLVPVWFVLIEDDFYICIEPSSIKGRNLRHNGHVSLALENGSHPIICEGLARSLEPPWPEKAVEAFLQKYNWEISSETRYTQLIEISPQKWLFW